MDEAKICSDSARGSVNKVDLSDWWIGTVVLSLVPFILTGIISLIKSSMIDVNRMFGDGELILSAFLITTPSIINCYNCKVENNKRIFYTLLLAAFFQLATYTSIKTNNNNNPWIVYIASGLCLAAALRVAYRGERTNRALSEE